MPTFLDAPIKEFTRDTFDRLSFVNSLCEQLVIDGKATGMTVGLTGPWGSGKSSTLNLLHSQLTAKGAVVVRFDPWLVSGRDELVSAFFVELLNAVRKKTGYYKVYPSGTEQPYDRALEAIAEYGEAVSPLFRILLPHLDIFAKLGALFITKERAVRSSLHVQKSLVRSSLEAFDFPIVVLIDELDRIEDGEIRAMAQLIRSIADFQSMSYVVAYDEARVIEALGGGDTPQNRERGRAYLEKIVNIRAPLPVLSASNLRQFAKGEILGALSDLKIRITGRQSERLDEVLRIAIPSAIATGRDVRRLVIDIAGRLRSIGDEVDAVDCVAFGVIQMKSVALLSVIREALDGTRRSLFLKEYFHAAVVQESGLSALTYGLDVYQDGANAKWEDKLFAHILPHCTARRIEAIEKNRIMFERPMLTLVRHGLPAEHLSTKGVAKWLKGGRPPALVIRALSAGDIARIKSVLWRLEEQESVVDNAIDTLLRDISQLIESRARTPELGILGTADILEVRASFYRIYAKHASSRSVDIPKLIAALIKSDQFILPTAMLLSKGIVRGVQCGRIGIDTEMLDDKKRKELVALLGKQLDGRGASILRSSSLALWLLAARDEMIVVDAASVSSRAMTIDLLELYYSAKESPAQLPVSKDELTFALRKFVRSASDEKPHVARLVRKARKHVNFYSLNEPVTDEAEEDNSGE